ncbi:hypothetical protein BJY00DRAFT_312092 [Aspergillus carlsbadensis]|nr:hypothetical protein BJY00DRAFT_312092 [Aspergillus carlsbadensis]
MESPEVCLQTRREETAVGSGLGCPKECNSKAVKDMPCEQRDPPDSINLTDQTALITGGNVGLGLEAARQLAGRGLSRLILDVRTISKGEAAGDEIRRQSPECEVHVWPLDMDSFASMRAFGERIQSPDRLDIVIISAGIKLLEYMRALMAHEAHVQVHIPPRPDQFPFHLNRVDRPIDIGAASLC